MASPALAPLLILGAGAAALLAYEILRPKTALASPATKPETGGGGDVIIGPITEEPNTKPPEPVPAGYALDTGDEVTVAINRERAQFLVDPANPQNATINEEIRVAMSNLRYEIMPGRTTNQPGVQNQAYKTFIVTRAGYGSQLVTPDLTDGITVVAVKTSTGQVKAPVMR